MAATAPPGGVLPDGAVAARTARFGPAEGRRRSSPSADRFPVAGSLRGLA